MKRFIKYALIAVAAFVVIAVLEVIIALKMVDNVFNNVVIYNEEQYELVKYWQLDTDQYTEVYAFVGDAEAKNKKPNTAVKLIKAGDKTIIAAKVHKVENLYIKKGEKLNTSYDISEMTLTEINIDDIYTPLSSEMKGKLFSHFKNYSEAWKPAAWCNEEYEEIGPIRVKYKKYPELVYDLGSIARFENNFIFVPSEQEYPSISEEFIPIPFDPLSEKKREPLLSDEAIKEIAEIRLVSPRYDKKIDPEFYNDIIAHMDANIDKSYLASSKNNILGDIIISFKDGSESKTVGMLVYDDDDNFCLADARLNNFQQLRWVYPFPFEAH